MALEERDDRGFEFFDGLIQLANVTPEQPGQGFGFGMQTILKASALADQELTQASEFLQSTQLGGGGCPQPGFLSGAEPGDDIGVERVVLRPHQQAVSVAADPARIDDTDRVLLLMEKGRQGLAVTAGGFHAGVHLRDALFAQPAQELFEAGWTVGELMLSQQLIFLWMTQANVELVFADINAKNVIDFHVIRYGYGHEVWLGEASGANRLVEDLTRRQARRSGYGSIWPKTENWVRSPQELVWLKRGLGLPSSPPQASSRCYLYRQRKEPTSAAVSETSRSSEHYTTGSSKYGD